MKNFPYRSSHKEHLPVADSGLADLPLDWLSDKWSSLVFGRNPSTAPPHAHRKYFELAVFTEVMDELKSGDLYVEHSGDYDDGQCDFAIHRRFDRVL